MFFGLLLQSLYYELWTLSMVKTKRLTEKVARTTQPAWSVYGSSVLIVDLWVLGELLGADLFHVQKHPTLLLVLYSEYTLLREYLKKRTRLFALIQPSHKFLFHLREKGKPRKFLNLVLTVYQKSPVFCRKKLWWQPYWQPY